MYPLFVWSCAATSCLKDASISALKDVLFFSNILRKSSWENDEMIVDSSFVMDAVAVVSLVVFTMEVEYFFFLFSRLGNDFVFSMSYEARMCLL